MDARTNWLTATLKERRSLGSFAALVWQRFTKFASDGIPSMVDYAIHGAAIIGMMDFFVMPALTMKSDSRSPGFG